MAFDRWQADQRKSQTPDTTAVIDQYRQESGDEFLEQKLMAIKFVRDHSGVGLEEAKKAVDGYQPSGD